ncbi:MAG: ribosome small subunit-dependent GTPase A [Chlorobi bacterium]|nr:ribosome small subunit-dependent GTPase A [Chlorobiota bacterium]
MPTFRRKPTQKSIIRTDAAWDEGEAVAERTFARSHELKKDPQKHRSRANQVGCIVGVVGTHWLVEQEDAYAALHQEVFTPTHRCIVGGVVTSDNPDNESLLAVGDWVEYATNNDQNQPGVIVHVRQRSTRLFRQAPAERSMDVLAANVERAFFVHAVTKPYFSRRLLDRHLIAAEQGGVDPVVVLNKIDLGIPPEVEQAIAYYRSRLGLQVCLTSAVSGEGIDQLRALMMGNVSVLIGASGVGKSALLNACFGMDLQRVREISRKYQRGRHTTTSPRLFHLPTGGALIDTPGVREFALGMIAPEELAFYFHDFVPYSERCRYVPCTHTHEPECSVRTAVAQGHIDSERYESYLLIFESLQHQE